MYNNVMLRPYEHKTLSNHTRVVKFLSYNNENDSLQSMKEDMWTDDTDVFLDENRKQQTFGWLMTAENQLFFQCRWRECIYTFPHFDQFYKHVQMHVNDSIQLDGLVPICRVDGCNKPMQNLEMFNSHMKHHCYHALKMKEAFKYMQKKQNVLDEACAFAKDRQALALVDTITYMRCMVKDCDFATDSLLDLEQHIEKHPTNIAFFDSQKKIYSCLWSGCGFETPRKNTLTRHLLNHIDSKSCACFYCGQFISDMHKLDIHINRGKEGSFGCTYCHQFFNGKQLLRIHLRSHVKRYNCQQCPMSFCAPSALNYHIERVHTRELRYECEYCNSRYTNRFELKRHLMTHLNSTRHECEICSQKFKFGVQLDRHVVNKHIVGRHRYYCHLCPKDYATGDRLGRHLRDFHSFYPEEIGRKNFKYELCEDNKYRLTNMEKFFIEEQAPPSSNTGDESAQMRFNSISSTTILCADEGSRSWTLKKYKNNEAGLDTENIEILEEGIIGN